MSVDRDARRAAVLYEIVAVADRYTQDTPPASNLVRLADLKAAVARIIAWGSAGRRRAILELAGRCVAWLEHLAENEAKA